MPLTFLHRFNSRLSRPDRLAELILRQLSVLQRRDELLYDELIADFDSLGYPLRRVEFRRDQDLTALREQSSLINLAIATKKIGENFSGTVRDGTAPTGGDPYAAKRGELVICDGTATFDVELPEVALDINSDSRVNIKLEGSGGTITISDAGAGTIDGSASIDLTVANSSITVVVANGEYKIL